MLLKRDWSQQGEQIIFFLEQITLPLKRQVWSPTTKQIEMNVFSMPALYKFFIEKRLTLRQLENLPFPNGKSGNSSKIRNRWYQWWVVEDSHLFEL